MYASLNSFVYFIVFNQKHKTVLPWQSSFGSRASIFLALSLSLTPLLLSFRAYRRYYDRNGNSTYGSLFFRVLSVKREKMSTRMLLVLLVRCLDIMYIQKVMFSLVTMIMIFSYCIHIHIYECACVCLCAGVWLSCQHKKNPHNI